MQAGGVEAGARDHDAGTHPCAGTDAVGLLLEDSGDAEELAAEAEVLADVGVEADEELVGDDGGVAGESLLESVISGSSSLYRRTDRLLDRRL